MTGNNSAKSASNQWTIIKLLNWAAAYLKGRDIDSPRATGEILLAHALKCERIALYLNYDQPLVDDELKAFKNLIQRRIQREPVAYILGIKEFWSLDFEVNREVLIPRPETECVVETALDILSRHASSQFWRILDLGTGCGAIIIALAVQEPRHTYFASDRSIPAARVAHQNAKRNNCGERIHFFYADWLASLNRKSAAFNLIVSNPPYIPSHLIAGLQPEIHSYEPIAALDGSDDGLKCHKEIIAAAHDYLEPGGALLLEIGHDQRDDIRRLVSDTGHYRDFKCLKDYSGHDRVVSMYKRN
jgi:release factor glutamine methyltransferase